VPVLELPAVSVAEHETVVVAIANVLPEAGVHVTGSVPSTLSDAVAVNVTAAPLADVASRVWFAGSESTGGVRSIRTTNVLSGVSTLPTLSVAWKLTVVVPAVVIATLALAPVTVVEAMGCAPEAE
jgi:hypothetical protein